PLIVISSLSLHDALPISDASGALVGIVTHDDAMDVASDEATDDFHKSGGVSTMVGRLKDVSITVLYRKRVFWLVFLVFGNLLSGDRKSTRLNSSHVSISY